VTDPLHSLAQHPYFAGLPPQVLAAVKQRAVVRTYARGALVFSEGAAPTGLYVVLTGRVRVYKASHEGREQVLHHVGPGQSFNDVAAFDGAASPASAQALEPTVAALIPRSELLRLVRAHPEIAEAVIRVLAGRLRQMSALVEELALRPVVARVARALLRLAERGPVVTLPTRQELAAMAGTVREVATRALKQLERAGAVQTGPGRRLLVLDLALLARLAGVG
jgi:CRP/FNR family transcriptional regulator